MCAHPHAQTPHLDRFRPPLMCLGLLVRSRKPIGLKPPCGEILDQNRARAQTSPGKAHHKGDPRLKGPMKNDSNTSRCPNLPRGGACALEPVCIAWRHVGYRSRDLLHGPRPPRPLPTTAMAIGAWLQERQAHPERTRPRRRTYACFYFCARAAARTKNANRRGNATPKWPRSEGRKQAWPWTQAIPNTLPGAYQKGMHGTNRLGRPLPE